ncbi:MAG TPA: ExbD/TolR family protein [Hyphomicrobiales bacterium]|nr:ExbD/TolR family protein [Hyphomicrobiales bacterium]
MEVGRQKKRKVMAEINVVPMIDVMLVLLIVFMVTTPLITQGIKVDLPQANAEVAPDSDEETLVVSINADGEYFVSLGESSADDPTPVPLEQIGEMVGKIMAQNPAVPVFLEADASINYGVVTSLLSTLEGAGAPGVRLITQPAAQGN